MLESSDYNCFQIRQYDAWVLLNCVGGVYVVSFYEVKLIKIVKFYLVIKH